MSGWKNALVWCLLLAFDTASQLAFKLGADGLDAIPFGFGWLLAAVSTPWVAVAIACYLGAFLSWLLILRDTDLSRAFPLSAAAYLSVMLASAWLLGEPIDLSRWLGAGLIGGGVTILGGEA